MKNIKLFSERLYYRSPFCNVSLVADLIGDINCDTVKKAVKEAVSHFEILNAAVIQDNSGKCSFVVLDESKVVIESNCDEWGDRNEFIKKQRSYNYSLNEGKSAVIHLVSLQLGVRIYISVHHIIADGLSLVFLLNEIINQLSGAAASDAFYPINSLNTNEFVMSKDMTKKELFFKQHVEKRWLQNKKVFSDSEFKEMHDNVSNFIYEITEKVIEHEELSDLIAQCKKWNVTVTASMIAKVFIEDASIAKILIPVSVRNENLFFGNYVSQVDVLRKDVDSSGFWQMAQKINEILKREINLEKGTLDRLSFISNMECNLYDSMFFALYSDYKNKTSNEVIKLLGMKNEDMSVMISNLGKGNFCNSNITVENVFFYPSVSANQRYIVGIITNNNQMTMTFQKLEKTKYFGG